MKALSVLAPSLRVNHMRCASRAVHSVAQAGYALQADAYAAVRPGYAPAVITQCLRVMLALHAPGIPPAAPHVTDPQDMPHPGRTLKILDLAAGTGKLTQQLARVPWLDVTAAEPSASMRSAFKRALPSVPLIPAPADKLPVPDASYDAVLVAQAFHWFADPAGLCEVARVLRPGAPLLLLWNMEDRRVPWVRAYRDVYEYLDAQIPQYRLAHWRAVFRTPLAAALFKPLADVVGDAPVGDPVTVGDSGRRRQTAAADSSSSGRHVSSSSSSGGGPQPHPLLGERDLEVLASGFPHPGYSVGAEAALLATTFVQGQTDMVTQETLWTRVLSKSYVASQSDSLQQELRREVEGVLSQHPAVFRPPPGKVPGTESAADAAPSPDAVPLGPAGVPADWVAPLPVLTEVTWCVRRG